MLFVLDKNFNVMETLSNVGDFSKIVPYFEDVHTQDLATGAETFQFSTSANSPKSQHLTIGNYVAFKSGKHFKLFNIISIEETHDEDFDKLVYCEMAGIELINQVVRPMEVTGANIKKFMDAILQQTDWQIGIIDASFTDIHDFEFKEYKTVYSLIQEYVIGVFGAEIEYRVEIVNNRVVAKYIDVYRQRGNENGYRFEYSENISSISRSIDSSELVTALIGEGKNGITFKGIETPDKPMNQDFIADEIAYQQWNIKGTHLMGVFKADTDSPQELLKLTRKALEERSKPKAKYEVKVAVIGDVEIGDTVNIIDHAFNPPLYLTGRVVQLKKSKYDPSKSECVLANFKEVNSNISDEMRQIANQLEGYVDGKFPVGHEDIKDGAIGENNLQNGQIIKGTHIFANSITADKIDADAIETKHLSAGCINAEKAIIADATIDTAQIKDAAITSAKIKDAAIDTAQINDAAINSAKIQDAAIGTAQIADAAINNAKIAEAAIGTANIQDASITTAKIKDLSADKITAGDIDTERLTANVITAINASIGKIDADHITVGEIDAGKITSGEINTNILQSNIIKAINLSVEQAKIDSAKIGNLSADQITSGSISTELLTANIIKAINLSTEKIQADKITGLELEVKDASITTAKIQDLAVTNAKIGNAAVDTAKIKDASITSAKIGNGAIGTAQITDAAIVAAKIKDGEIVNAKIANATIDAAKIKSVNANTITAGKINTSNVEVSSTSGNMSLRNNTMQIKDAQNVVRVQLGEDATKDYGLIIRDNQGNTMWDFTGATANGIQNNAVTTDKIKDESITSSKLVIDEIWANEAFVSNFQAQEINANQITTGKITGEYIDITGLVSFDSLDPSISENFIPTKDENGNITKVWIDGKNIYAHSITGDQINTRGFTASDNKGETTFNIDKNDGAVTIAGTVYSKNYSNVKGKEAGYKLTPQGDAYLNNALIRGSLVLDTGGVTDFGSIANSGNLLKSTFNFAQYWGNVSGIITEGLDGAKAIINKRTNWSAGTPRQQITSVLDSTVKSGDQITLSGYYWVDSSVATSGQASNNNITIRVYEQGTSSFKDICDVPMQLDKTNQWIRFEATGTVPFTQISAAHLVFSVHTNGFFKLTLPKVEFGDKAYNWAPSAYDNANLVRMWAGTSYDNRENAPFRVLQDGSVIATKGNFGGTITGKLNIGNIVIEDTNSTNGYIDIKNNDDSKTLVHLEEINSYIKSNLAVGDFVNFDTSGSILQVKGRQVLSNGNVLITLNDGSTVVQTSDSRGTHLQRYNSGSFIFEAQGSNEFGDYLFKRMDQPVDVRMDGDLFVRDKITMNNNIAIVSRQDSGNSGFDYVVK